MKGTRTTLLTLSALFGFATNLLAATGERVDTSSFLIWAFLGMCALIVIVQLMPAMMLVFGMLKAVFSNSEREQVKAQE